jgi:hypothetical protein
MALRLVFLNDRESIIGRSRAMSPACHALPGQLKKEFYMHIMTSLYNAMTRLSDAIINAMPGRGSYTLNHKIHVVKSTSNGPGKRTTEWQPKMKSPPVRLEKYRIISEEFPEVPQKPNQTSTGARRDILFTQSERKKIVDAMKVALKEHKEQKAEKQTVATSGASRNVATSCASPPISTAAQAGLTIDTQVPHSSDHDIIRPWQPESEWSALAPLPVRKKMAPVRTITKQMEIQGGGRKKRAAPPSPTVSRKTVSPVGAGDDISATHTDAPSSGKTGSVITEKTANVLPSSAEMVVPPPVVIKCHPKLPPAQAEIGQKMSQQVLAGELKIVLGTRNAEKSQLAGRSFSEPGSRLASIVDPSLLHATRSKLKSVDARTAQPVPAQASTHELETVFARRRTKQATAMAAQRIAALERGRGSVTSSQSDADEVDFQRYVTADNLIDVDAYMKDYRKRLMHHA